MREDNKDLNQSVTYTYDTMENILKIEYYDYTTGTLGNVVDTINYTYDSTWKDKLLNYDGYSFSYDSIGNPTIYRGTEVTWEKGRQLKSFNDGNTVIMSFEYNIDGLRTQKYFLYTDTTTNYLWSSGLLMQQSDGTNTLNFVYAPDGTALSVNYNGSEYYYLYNLQGDVIALYNTIGTVVVKYTYDSWGKLISTTGSLASTLGTLNPFRYRGYIYDEETELYWLRSRYYDPEIGRFLNADVYVSTGTGLNGFNLFAYCNNNPILFVDSNGNRPIVGTSIENETSEERFLSFATMNDIQVKTIQTDFSGAIYVMDANTLNNTNSASAKALINNSGNGYFVVVDNRNNGYIEIINSYKNKNIAKQADMLNALTKYTRSTPVNYSVWNRTLSSMFIEWTWHNLFYSIGFMRSNAKSASFDMYPFCNTDSMLIQIFGELTKRYGG